jgi:hypothetical protein
MSLGRGASPGKKVTVSKKMQNARTKGKCSSAQLIESLKKRTHFSRKEIEALLKLHRSLAASAQKKPLPRGQPPGNADGFTIILLFSYLFPSHKQQKAFMLFRQHFVNIGCVKRYWSHV